MDFCYIVCYYMVMQSQFTSSAGGVVSLIEYHFVFCPRYRRKIFQIPGVAEYFTTLVRKICSDLQIRIISLQCCEDHVLLSIRCLPDRSPAEIMKKIKGASTKPLKEVFPQLKAMTSIWTRDYLVSTEVPDEQEISNYVQSLKKRG